EQGDEPVLSTPRDAASRDADIGMSTWLAVVIGGAGLLTWATASLRKLDQQIVVNVDVPPLQAVQKFRSLLLARKHERVEVDALIVLQHLDCRGHAVAGNPGVRHPEQRLAILLSYGDLPAVRCLPDVGRRVPHLGHLRGAAAARAFANVIA